jgi:hypothetical protein
MHANAATAASNALPEVSRLRYGSGGGANVPDPATHALFGSDLLVLVYRRQKLSRADVDGFTRRVAPGLKFGYPRPQNRHVLVGDTKSANAHRAGWCADGLALPR